MGKGEIAPNELKMITSLNMQMYAITYSKYHIQCDDKISPSL